MGFLDRLLNRPLSSDDFAEMLIKRIRASGDDRPVVYEREEFRLRKEGGALSFLHNIYQEYLRVAKSEREQVVRNFLTMWHTTGKPLPQDFADVQADILPALRARSFFEVDVQRANDGKARVVPPYETVAEHLAVSLVYDLPTAMRTISDEELEEWGMSFYEAMEVAKRNLADKPIQYAEIGSLYSLANGDAYEATRMILLDLIRSLKVPGKTIAMVPNRERLYVAGSEDAAALKAMLKFSEGDLQHERFISGMAFRLDGDEWQLWLPAEDHPLYAQFRKFYVQSFGQMYAEQASLLELQHQQSGKDVYVASFSGLHDESTGVDSSYCMWLEGCDSLLPQTDEVFFVRPAGTDVKIVARGQWDVVRRLVGDAMEAQGTYPPRWRVNEFPQQQVLDQLTPWPR